MIQRKQILRSNFERNMKSVGHLKYLEVETGAPAEAKQSTMDSCLGTFKQHGVKAVTSLLKTAFHIGRKENQFKAIEL